MARVVFHLLTIEEMPRRPEEMVEEHTRQLQQTHEKLLHQDKMASLGKLSASVVHELNNYRLNVISIDMPPLKDRKEDIPLLAEQFLHRFRRETNKAIDGISQGAMDEMMLHEWPAWTE